MLLLVGAAELDPNMRDSRFSRVVRRLNALVLVLMLVGYLAVPLSNAVQLLGAVTAWSTPLFLAMHGLRREASDLSRNGALWINLAAGLLALLAIGVRVYLYGGMRWPQWWMLPGLSFLGSLALLSAVALIFKNDDADADLYRSAEPATQGRGVAPGQRIEPVFTEPAMAADVEGGSTPPWTADAPQPALAMAASLPITSTDAPPANASSSRRGNYFLRHWRGELSLPVSYWLNSVGIAFVISIGGVIAKRAYNDAPLRWNAAFTVVLLCLSLPLWIWSSVGIWRSASRRSRSGGGRGWAITAQITVLLGVLCNLGNLKLVMLPDIHELGLMALGLDPIGKAEVKLSADGRTVYFSGGLRTGAADQALQVLRAAPQAHMLVLDSYGGRIAEAEVLAREVQARGMDTHVEKLCASACTYVFLAGKQRTAAPTAKIGFHQPSFPGLQPELLRGETERMLNHYRAAGLPEAFVRRVGVTPGTSMWYPTQSELRTANVVTEE
jgi:hypothetical protein